MNIKFLVLLVVCLSLFGSCSSQTAKSPHRKTDLEEMNLKGPVKALDVYSLNIDSYEAFLNADSSYVKDNYSSRIQLRFNDAGYLVKWNKYKTDSYHEYEISYAYDEENKLIKTAFNNYDTKESYQIIQTYNEGDDLIAQQTISNEIEIDREEYQYDASGNIVTILYFEYGDLVRKTTKKYDQQNRHIASNQYQQGKLQQIVKYTYKGNELSPALSYLYDPREEMIEYSSFKYRSDGEIEKYYTYSPDGELRSKMEYVFNKSGLSSSLRIL